MCRTNTRAPGSKIASEEEFASRLVELAAMPSQLDAAAASVSPMLWKTRPAAGGFSLVEHACHLRDVDSGAFTIRLERLLSEVMPVLEGFDGAKVARERNYIAQNFEEARAAFAGTRAALVKKLQTLTPVERVRTGLFSGVGEITIDDLVVKILEHDGEHRQDLEALVTELKAR